MLNNRAPSIMGSVARRAAATDDQQQEQMALSHHSQRSNSPTGRPAARKPRMTIKMKQLSSQSICEEDMNRIIVKLQSDMNEASVKHRDEQNWLKLELDTTRQEKESIENRLAELYKDMQNTEGAETRVMHNQLALMKESSDSIVKTLKDEIYSLLQEKTHLQGTLMAQASDFEKERLLLLARHDISDHGHSNHGPRRVSVKIKGGEIDKMQKEMIHLRLENKRLASELAHEKKKYTETSQQLIEDNGHRGQQVEALQSELAVVRSSPDGALIMEQIQVERTEIITLMGKVSDIWNKADESIQTLDTVIQELKHTNNVGEQPSEDQERLLSTLETATLVNGQVKISLLLVELKLRNNLACLKNDKAHMGLAADHEVLEQRFLAIEDNALAAIDQIKLMLQEEMERLHNMVEEDDSSVRDTTTTPDHRSNDLSRMEKRQFMLQERMSQIMEDESCDIREEVSQDGTLQQYVSTKVLEELQNQVLIVLNSVNEKNHEIERLNATVEELTVRERSLMADLRRLMAEQAAIEQEARQRRMEAMKAQDSDSSSDEDDNSDAASGFAESAEFSVEIMDDDEYDEVTYYEEVMEDSPRHGARSVG
jgi:hypothetical protein